MRRLPLIRSCKEITSMVIAREDRALLWVERVALRLHMGYCEACPAFERQIKTMHQAMQQWRHYNETPSGDE